MPWSGARRRQQAGKSIHDLAHDLVQQRKNVSQIAVEPVSPEMDAVRRVDELDVDTDAGYRPAHAAFDNEPHTQIFGDRPDVN